MPPPSPHKLRTLTAATAAALDAELMSTSPTNPHAGHFTLDQLMELAGLAVSQTLYKLCPLGPRSATPPRVLIACGPGNNGGDGLVAARHLALWGYGVSVFYPKPGKTEIFARLRKQVEGLRIPVLTTTQEWMRRLHSGDEGCDYVIDALFGFSFKGAVREPFVEVIASLRDTKIPVLAVDAPSSWDIEGGPPREGPGEGYVPTALVSLTAPKGLVEWFPGRHFVGGRFISREVAERFGFDLPAFEGDGQVVEVENDLKSEGEGKL